jgi:OTU domain-containing protein 5
MVRFDKSDDDKSRRNVRNTNNGPFSRNINRRTNQSDGYNSEDERPRSIVKKIDDEGVKHVSVQQLRESLAKKGLQVVIMPPDGNCLFHAVADQIYGDHSYHDVVRKQCLDYMEKERNHFSQFITEDFNAYIARKRQLGVHGNHVELQAITEIYSRPVEIYALDENPLNIFQGSYEVDNPPIMLSYHFGNHYNSVRDPNKPTAGFGLGLPGLKTVEEINNDNLNEAIKESEFDELSQIIAKTSENDLDHVEESLLNLAKKESEQDDGIFQNTLYQSELDIMQQAIERSIMEQSLREYFSRNK